MKYVNWLSSRHIACGPGFWFLACLIPSYDGFVVVREREPLRQTLNYKLRGMLPPPQAVVTESQRLQTYLDRLITLTVIGQVGSLLRC